jgi:hypothetical protein
MTHDTKTGNTETKEEYTPTDHGPGIENYDCDGCRVDGNTCMSCGWCLHNEERRREYRRKYIY